MNEFQLIAEWLGGNILTGLWHINPDLLTIPVQVKASRCALTLLVDMTDGFELEAGVKMADAA